MIKPFVTDDYGNKQFLKCYRIVCPTCDGDGSIVNPSIDGNGISTSSEIWQDEDFRSSYTSGAYDITCPECKGLRVCDYPDPEDNDPKLVRQWENETYGEF